MERSVFPTDERKVRCGDGEIEHEDKDMTEKELKKLSRTDLLSMLLKKTRENEKLQAEIEALEEKLSARMITINNAGSLAGGMLTTERCFRGGAGCSSPICGEHSGAERTAGKYLCKDAGGNGRKMQAYGK